MLMMMMMMMMIVSFCCSDWMISTTWCYSSLTWSYASSNLLLSISSSEFFISFIVFLSSDWLFKNIFYIFVKFSPSSSILLSSLSTFKTTVLNSFLVGRLSLFHLILFSGVRVFSAPCSFIWSILLCPFILTVSMNWLNRSLSQF